MKIYNSMTRMKEEFYPIEPGKIKMYVCGVTVYDLCHIGHARMVLSFDIVARFLKYIGYDVTYVRNITDIDDKIIKIANDKKEDIKELTNRNIKYMHEDFDALGMIKPTQEPRATDYIKNIIELIARLEDRGYAYVAKSGDVIFDVNRFEDYGKLSKRKLEHNTPGMRVSVADDKRNPYDFVLWKLSKPGEPTWDSPWGAGRPGWHIECSGMAIACLANVIDIHGGGLDLQFPHHENEIAQTRAATSENHLAHYWMHVGFVNIDKEKMSKSTGKYYTIREILEKYDPEIIRFFVVASHYRGPIEFTFSQLDQAEQSLCRLYQTLRGFDDFQSEVIDKNDSFYHQFIACMEDDFNTPGALAVLFELSKKINKLKEAYNAESIKKAGLLKHLANILGILNRSPDEFFKKTHTVDAFSINEKIEKIIEDRNKARADKDWGKADLLREELIKLNVVLEDTSEGTVWRFS